MSDHPLYQDHCPFNRYRAQRNPEILAGLAPRMHCSFGNDVFDGFPGPYEQGMHPSQRFSPSNRPQVERTNPSTVTSAGENDLRLGHTSELIPRPSLHRNDSRSDNTDVRDILFQPPDPPRWNMFSVEKEASVVAGAFESTTEDYGPIGGHMKRSKSTTSVSSTSSTKSRSIAQLELQNQRAAAQPLAPKTETDTLDLQLHIDRNHPKVVKTWICVEPSDVPDIERPIKPLNKCKACSQQKEYGAYYGAAAHLRRVHFHPKIRGRLVKAEEIPDHKRLNGVNWPSMGELRKWIKEISLQEFAVQEFRGRELEDDTYSKDEHTVDDNGTRDGASMNGPWNVYMRTESSPTLLLSQSENDWQGYYDTELNPFSSGDNFSNLIDSKIPNASETLKEPQSHADGLSHGQDNILNLSELKIFSPSGTFEEFGLIDGFSHGQDSFLNYSEFKTPSASETFQRPQSYLDGFSHVQDNASETVNEPLSYVDGFAPKGELLSKDENLDEKSRVEINGESKIYDEINIGDQSQFTTENENRSTSGTADDSGYASMKMEQNPSTIYEEADDNATVVTDNQSLDLEQEAKEKLISAFTIDVLRHLHINIVALSKSKLRRDYMAGLLKDLSVRLRSTADSRPHTHASTFVRHYRHRITNALATSLRELRLPDECDEDQQDATSGNNRTDDKCLSLDEKMNLLWDNQREAHDVQEERNNVEVEDEVEDDSDGFAMAHFPEAWSFLKESQAYKWFIGKLNSAALLTEEADTTMDHIGKCLFKNLGQAVVCSTTIHIKDWALSKFVRDQYGATPAVRIASVITITGSGNDAQAITCAEYMAQVWPVTGLQTLDALQKAVDLGTDIPHTYSMSDKTTLSLTLQKETVAVVVRGSKPAVIEIGQQLAWLGSALRASPSPDSLSYCRPRISMPTHASTPQFQINFDFRESLHGFDQSLSQNGSCWRPLFRNPVVVEGFPILARQQGEKGLEMPLNIMAGLGEATRVTCFNGGLLVKGFSTLFCPMKRVKNSVLWHFLHEKDGSRMSYISADSLHPSRAMISQVDKACLNLSRHFLGWTSSVECHAGTRHAKYDEIEWPGPNYASAGIAFEKASVIVLNYVSGGASFTRGIKDTPIFLSLGGPYEREIHSACNMKVVLYDVVDRRGWLVDGGSALLHLTRTQLGSSPYVDSEHYKIEDFQHADGIAGIFGAKKALLSHVNRNLVIFEDTDHSQESNGDRRNAKKWTYQDLVRQTYHVLEQMHDYEATASTSSSVQVRFTNREKLTGFAFMDIVDGQNDLRPRVAILKSSGRGWVDFTRSIRAITLLGKGFGQIFSPSIDSNRLCRGWRHVPTGKDYLVVSTATLKDICRKHGNHGSKPLELAQGVFWHRPDMLYESCDCDQSQFSKNCDRVQVLLPPSLGKKHHPQPFGHLSGAVIFGRSKRFPWRWPSSGHPAEGEESDSEPDDSSGLEESRVGGSETSVDSYATNSSPIPSTSSEFKSRNSSSSITSGSGIDSQGADSVILEPGGVSENPFLLAPLQLRTSDLTTVFAGKASELLPIRGKEEIDAERSLASAQFGKHPFQIASEAESQSVSGQDQLCKRPWDWDRAKGNAKMATNISRKR